jgi:hypothetical protein
MLFLSYISIPTEYFMRLNHGRRVRKICYAFNSELDDCNVNMYCTLTVVDTGRKIVLIKVGILF